MALADDIAAVDANEALSPAEKRRAKSVLRCQSLYEALLPFVGESKTFRHAQVDWTILNLWLVEDGAKLRMCIRAVGTAGADAGKRLIQPQQIHTFWNPPCLDAVYADNRVQAAKEMLERLLP